MLRTIHLHGALAERFQPTYDLDVATPGEAIRAIMCQVPGFEVAIRDGEFVCVRGDYETGIDCDEELLQLNLGQLRDFHIIPAAVGRKSGSGTGKILLGVALIAATVVTGGMALAASGAFAAMGVMGTSAVGIAGATIAAGFGGFGAFTFGLGALLVLGGTAQAISKVPTGGDLNDVDEKPGYLFNGAINTSEQGGPVPLVFGRIRAGSVVVSAGVIAERVGAGVGGVTTGLGSNLPASTGFVDVVTWIAEN